MQHGHANPRVQARPAQAHQIIPGIFFTYIRFTYLTLSGSLSHSLRNILLVRELFPQLGFSRHLHLCESPLMVQWLNTCLPRRRPEFDSRMVQKIFSHLFSAMGGGGGGVLSTPFCVLMSLKIWVRAARSKPACL
jgi:hypothetical protein